MFFLKPSEGLDFPSMHLLIQLGLLSGKMRIGSWSNFYSQSFCVSKLCSKSNFIIAVSMVNLFGIFVYSFVFVHEQHALKLNVVHVVYAKPLLSSRCPCIKKCCVLALDRYTCTMRHPFNPRHIHSFNLLPLIHSIMINSQACGLSAECLCVGCLKVFII